MAACIQQRHYAVSNPVANHCKQILCKRAKLKLLKILFLFYKIKNFLGKSLVLFFLSTKFIFFSDKPMVYASNER